MRRNSKLIIINSTGILILFILCIIIYISSLRFINILPEPTSSIDLPTSHHLRNSPLSFNKLRKSINFPELSNNISQIDYPKQFEEYIRIQSITNLSFSPQVNYVSNYPIPLIIKEKSPYVARSYKDLREGFIPIFPTHNFKVLLPRNNIDPDYDKNLYNANNDFNNFKNNIIKHIDLSIISPDSSAYWLINFIAKLNCLERKKQALFLYHFRKAAGTNLRGIYSHITALKHHEIQLYETEGIVLNEKILNTNMIIGTTLRHPIERIMSLYLYEHLAHCLLIKKSKWACKSFPIWVESW